MGVVTPAMRISVNRNVSKNTSWFVSVLLHAVQSVRSTIVSVKIILGVPETHHFRHFSICFYFSVLQNRCGIFNYRLDHSSIGFEHIVDGRIKYLHVSIYSLLKRRCNGCVAKTRLIHQRIGHSI